MKNIFNYFFLLLLKTISFFLIIKIGEIETRTIGHYSKSIDLFLSEKKFFKNKMSKKFTFEIWFTNKFVANEFLLKKWKDILFILPYNRFLNYFFVNFFFFLKKKNSRRVFLVNYRDWREVTDWQIRDIHKIYMKSEQNFFFSEKEIKVGENILRKMIPNYNKNKKLVCIHCRDLFYHRYKDINIFSKDKNLKDRFRKVDINNFIKGIYLANTHDYNVIRVGSIHETKLELDKKKFNFFDYSFSEYKSDFMDLFLAYKADLYLGSDSGLVMFPGLFRKEMMMHNIISITTLKDFDDFTCSLINFKKIYSKILGRFITFSENYKLKILNYQDDEFFSKKLEVIESSEDEIENFIQECIWIKENKNNSYFNCDLQNKARNLLRQFQISNMSNIRISPYFLKKYSKLIE